MKKNQLFGILLLFSATLIYGQTPVSYDSMRTVYDAYYDSIIQVNGIDSMQGTGYNPYQRWLAKYGSYLDAYGGFDIMYSHRDSLFSHWSANKNTQANSDIGTLIFSELGPVKLPTATSAHFNGLGQIHYIVFEPGDSSLQKMYCCSPFGGLWKSSNGGTLWENAGTDKGLPFCGISSVAIDPANPDLNWFVTTGNGEAMPVSKMTFDANGVFRSVDGGSSWDSIGLHGKQMRKAVFVRRNDTVRLFVVTVDGLYMNTDPYNVNAHSFWTQISGSRFFDIEIDPTNSQVIYASCDNEFSIYKYDWYYNQLTRLATSSTITSEPGIRISFEISPAAPNKMVIVAIYHQNSGAPKDEAYLYNFDLITSSLSVPTPLPDAAYAPTSVGAERAMGWAISPVFSVDEELRMLFGNTAPIYEIQNVLVDTVIKTFTDISTANGAPSTYSGTKIHVDMHYMLFTPDGDELWVGCDGGVFRTVFPDPLANWEEMNDGLGVATATNVAIGKNTDIVLSGHFDCGSHIFEFSGGQWQCENFNGGDGYDCSINPLKSGRLIGTTQWFTTYTKETFDANWKRIIRPTILSGKTDFGSVFENSRTNDKIIHLPTFIGLYTSNDGGDSWSLNSNLPSQGNGVIGRVKTSDRENNIVFLSAFDTTTTPSTVHLFRSESGGGTSTSDWEDYGSPPINTNHAIGSICIDHSNSRRVWITYSSKVYEIDENKNWTDISSGIPAWVRLNRIDQIEGMHPGLLAGTNYGLYFYNNSSSVWSKVDCNLPNSEITDVEIDNVNGRIAVATYGRGIWLAQLPCAGWEDDIEISTNTVIDTTEAIYGSIQVSSGDTLTIINSYLHFQEGAKIVVEPGA